MQWITNKLGEVWGFVLQLVIYGLLFGALFWAITHIPTIVRIAKIIFGFIYMIIMKGIDGAQDIGNGISSSI